MTAKIKVCPRCSEINPERAKHCLQCGNDLSAVTAVDEVVEATEVRETPTGRRETRTRRERTTTPSGAKIERSRTTRVEIDEDPDDTVGEGFRDSFLGGVFKRRDR